MRRRVVAAIALLVVLHAAAASAQPWEASALVGLTPSADLDRRAPELTELDIHSGVTWGLQGGRSITGRWSVEGLWMQQASALRVGTSEATADLFSMTVGQLQGNVVYHWSAAGVRLRPFLLAGVGATFFSADDVESETKLSIGLGGGLKYAVWRNLGVRGQFRYKPTFINDEDDDFCEPFGFCQGTLHQIEFAAGVLIRF